jgi:two-component system, sensor histidine kinase and response regulator
MEEKKSLILVVDDIPSNVEFITDILSTIPAIEIQGLNDGISALSFVAKKKPDLILLDVSMPKLDGFEVCIKLKSNPEYASIPVIFLTARVQKEDIVKGFEIGAVDYIAKPFNMSELLSRVKTHLELNQKSKALLEINTKLEELVQERTKQLVATNKNLSEANRKLTEAYEALSTLDNAKNDFIAHINHELRTPLNGILGYTTLLEEQITGESKTYINSINNLVSRLIKVAEISLLLTELKTINNEINIREVAVADIITRALPENQLSDKNILAKVNLSNPNQTVMGEARLMTTCLDLILDNAVKYSPSGGTISISGRDNDTYYSLDISDEGPGFSANALSSLFELFTADNLDYRTYGFGLGLTTAKKITDLLGGRINIRNRDKGASVVLHFKKAHSK